MNNKLPTAYQSAQEHNAVDKYGKPESEVIKAIDSHTAAHTAALNKYNSVLIEEKQELLERLKELEAKIASYESAIDGLKKVVDSLYNLKS